MKQIHNHFVYIALATVTFAAGCAETSNPASNARPVSGSRKTTVINPNATTPTPDANSNTRGFNGTSYYVEQMSCISNSSSIGTLSFNPESTSSGQELNFVYISDIAYKNWFWIDFDGDKMTWDDIPLSSTVATNENGDLCTIYHTSHVEFTKPLSASAMGSLKIKDIIDTQCSSSCPEGTCENLSKDQFSNYLIGASIPYSVNADQELDKLQLFAKVNDACISSSAFASYNTGAQLEVRPDPYAE